MSAGSSVTARHRPRAPRGSRDRDALEVRDAHQEEPEHEITTVAGDQHAAPGRGDRLGDGVAPARGQRGAERVRMSSA